MTVPSMQALNESPSPIGSIALLGTFRNLDDPIHQHSYSVVEIAALKQHEHGIQAGAPFRQLKETVESHYWHCGACQIQDSFQGSRQSWWASQIRHRSDFLDAFERQSPQAFRRERTPLKRDRISLASTRAPYAFRVGGAAMADRTAEPDRGIDRLTSPQK